MKNKKISAANFEYLFDKKYYRDYELETEIAKELDVWHVYFTIYCDWCKEICHFTKPCRKIAKNKKKFISVTCSSCNYWKKAIWVRDDFPFQNEVTQK